MREYDLIIVGAGPAGLAAGIYAGRAGLSTLTLEKGVCGGLLAEISMIENYPGFKKIAGLKLANRLKEHAREYGAVREGEEVSKLLVGKGIRVKTTKREYKAGAILLATGSERSRLGVEGEDKLVGKGVSYCATCDGLFFKGKKVLVVGGGNVALTDALHLSDLGCRVTLIHRRDELRGEKILQDKFLDSGGEILWNSVVEEIRGTPSVERVIVRNLKSAERDELKSQGIFIAVGEMPNNVLAKQLNLKLDRGGYIITNHHQRTSMRNVYAAGDVTGGVKQVLTAVAEGSIAALSAYEDLKHPYWASEYVEYEKNFLARDE